MSGINFFGKNYLSHDDTLYHLVFHQLSNTIRLLSPVFTKVT